MSHSMSSSVLDDDIDLTKRMRRLIPEQIQDRVAMFIFVFMLPIIFSCVFFVVLPTWYPTFGEAWVLRVVPLVYFLLNIYLNFFEMIRVGPNGRDYILPNTFKAGYIYCHHCHTNAPPRSHHCPVCNVCVLRRDHHCSFGAVCVGHFNQRYFCAGIANLFLVTVPSLWWSWEWMWIELGSLSISRFWQLVMPHVALLLRFLSLNEFICVGFTGVIFTVLIFDAYLITSQLFCLIRGQTRVEYLLDVHAYQLGAVENMKQALGSRWYLIWLSPFLPSPLESNGLSFRTREAQQFQHQSKSL